MSRIAVIALGVAVMGATGCSEQSQGPTRVGYSIREIPFGSRAIVVPTAAKAVRAQGFEVARMDATEGIVETYPIESQEAETARPVSGVLGRTRRVRRVAHVHVLPANEAVKVACKVVIEEYETEARRLRAREHTISDIPSETPAERDAATSEAQNASWRVCGRDRAMEQQILETILAQAAPPSD